ncbi:hypothetical protein QOZ80_9AG0671230 [Eleusine coracana subsp. coracana]|nr:hypothetical protein QOZ80_9AG0671230 [Eleusine coracana subsp. coracana]
MPVVAFSIPPQWLCSECQEKANGNSIPNQGGQNELQSACSMTNERETPKLDLGHNKGKFTCQVQHEHREKETFCASVEATGCESKIWSPSHNKGTLLIMGSSAEYSRRPAPEICWTGCFLVLYAGTKHNLGEFKAYFPSKVLDRIYNITKAMPTTLEFEMLPRMDDWPTTFGITPPTYGDIGMFFLSNKFDGHEKKDPDLLETSCNYVMRAYIDDIKLLIYSSELLPPDSQWVDGKSYLWGIFVRPARKRSHRHLSSTST